MAASGKPTASKPARWQLVLLPLLASALHVRVFFASVRSIFHTYRSATSQVTTEDFLGGIYAPDHAVFVAYFFDLACCCWNVVPFSRCNGSRDIVGHHLPTLLLALPLAVPLWTGWRAAEPTSFAVLDLDAGDDLRRGFVDAYTLASGFAYVSSLNDVIMCLQRTEMNLQGVESFRDVKDVKHGIFTSRVAIYAELAYKLSFFWGMSWLACKACCDFDRALYDHATTVQGMTMLKALLATYSSPA